MERQVVRCRTKGCDTELISAEQKRHGYCIPCLAGQNADRCAADKLARAKAAEKRARRFSKAEAQQPKKQEESIKVAAKPDGQVASTAKHKGQEKDKGNASVQMQDASVFPGANSKNLGIRIPQSALVALKKVAKERKETATECARRLILEGLAK